MRRLHVASPCGNLHLEMLMKVDKLYAAIHVGCISRGDMELDQLVPVHVHAPDIHKLIPGSDAGHQISNQRIWHVILEPG